MFLFLCFKPDRRRLDGRLYDGDHPVVAQECALKRALAVTAASTVWSQQGFCRQETMAGNQTRMYCRTAAGRHVRHRRHSHWASGAALFIGLDTCTALAQCQVSNHKPVGGAGETTG
jgi:hypothetical protein